MGSIKVLEKMFHEFLDKRVLLCWCGFRRISREFRVLQNVVKPTESEFVLYTKGKQQINYFFFISALELDDLGPDHVQVFWKQKCFGNISQLETTPMIG